ncbi:MAG: iron-sulfur cluster-binding protein [Clostridia bacterium]|jgi:uncharacterized protein (DUF362 family)|nr:iron-sulfur cluster-binding protein [Clostridia bacterium]
MKRNDIVIKYGDTPKSMVKDILDKIKIEEEINPNMLIGIKPNLVVAQPSVYGATTSPELAAGVIEYLQSKGFKNIIILEGSWIGDRTSSAFKACGYEALSKKYNVPLFDLQKDSSKVYQVEDMKINVCDKAMEVDYMINMPVLKGHCQTSITCALKNMKGCITDKEKRKFHTMGLHKPIAYLNKVVKQDLIIVDGLMGDLNFEEGGNPVQMNRVIAAKDPVLMDAYAAHLMGYEVDEIEYIRIAEAIGIGSADIRHANIDELNKDKLGRKISPTRRVQHLAKHVDEKDACSACYGSLIHALDRMDNKGSLTKLKKKIYIGQGYKNQNCPGIGIGECAKHSDEYIPGCPPSAKQILQYLENNV